MRGAAPTAPEQKGRGVNRAKNILEATFGKERAERSALQMLTAIGAYAYLVRRGTLTGLEAMNGVWKTLEHSDVQPPPSFLRRWGRDLARASSPSRSLMTGASHSGHDSA